METASIALNDAGQSVVMEQTLQRPRAEMIALSFLIDEVGIGEENAARLISSDMIGVQHILEGHGTATEEEAKAMRAVIAIQSLLLSAYTPRGVLCWMMGHNPDLGGESPEDVLSEAEEGALSRVLGAAYGRIVS